jgi:hypothetical protein
MSTAALLVFSGWVLLMLIGLGCSVWKWWQEKRNEPDLAARYRELWALKNDDVRRG